LTAAKGGEGVVVHGRDVFATQIIFSRGRTIQAAEDVEHGGFAGAGSPHDGHVGTLFDGQVHTIEGVDIDIAHSVGLDQIFDPDDIGGGH
jgi:hypothetical protein